MKNNREKYEKFWGEFGKSLKIGIYNSIYSGDDTVSKLKDLLLFDSSKEGKLTSLKEYVDRMATNVPGLFAAGDCTGGLLQVAKAVYEGAAAGLSAIKYLRSKNK